MDKINATRWGFSTKKIDLCDHKSLWDKDEILNLEMFREEPADPEKEYWWPVSLLLGVYPTPNYAMGPLLVAARAKRPNATLREAFTVRRHQSVHYGLAVFEAPMEDKLIIWQSNFDAEERVIRTGITECKA